MKKIIFTVFALIAFSEMSIGKEKIEDASNCDQIATFITNQKEAAFHSRYGLCFTSYQYNTIRAQYMEACEATERPFLEADEPTELIFIDEQVFNETQP